MSRQVKATLRGPDAELGRIASADFANLLLATERAIARAAGHLIRRPVKERGRWETVIEEASRLRLVAVKPGSVSAVLETPDIESPPDSLGMDVADLSEMALQRVLEAASGTAADDMPDVDQVLATAATQIGVGSRFDEIVLETIPRNGEPVVKAVINNERRIALGQRPRRPPQPNRIFGILVEADFESLRAHLRTVTGDRVSVDFDSDLADEIQDALRHQTELAGEVTYDPATGRAKSVRLRELTRAEQLVIDIDVDFWQTPSVDDLAAEQGTEPATVWDKYRGPSLSDDEVDEMLTFLDS